MGGIQNQSMESNVHKKNKSVTVDEQRGRRRAGTCDILDQAHKGIEQFKQHR